MVVQPWGWKHTAFIMGGTAHDRSIFWGDGGNGRGAIGWKVEGTFGRILLPKVFLPIRNGHSLCPYAGIQIMRTPKQTKFVLLLE